MMNNTPAKDTMQTYTNTAYGLSLHYPHDAVFTTDRDKMEQAGNREQGGRLETINGLDFQTFGYGDAAAGHQSSGDDYCVFLNDMCYQISTRINTTTFENYEPGTLARFTEEERKELEQKLSLIISSFIIMQ